MDGRPGLGVWVWTPSWSCRQKTLESASREIAGRRESGRVAALGAWSGTPRCALLTAETHPGTVPTGRAAVGITCRDGDPAETLLWPCHGQDSPNAPGPLRGRAPKTSAVKARNRAPRLRTLRPSCQPPPPHGQRSGAAQPQCRGRRRGRASGMPGEPWQPVAGAPGAPSLAAMFGQKRAWPALPASRLPLTSLPRGLGARSGHARALAAAQPAWQGFGARWPAH